MTMVSDAADGSAFVVPARKSLKINRLYRIVRPLVKAIFGG
jgi:hypothetical protein